MMAQRVTYHYRSHRTERVEHETVDVNTFIGRMVQHTMPKGFKRIRYYGVQATKTFAKVKVADSSGAGQGGGGGQGRGEDHRPADLSATVRAEHGSRSLDLSALSGRDGGVAHLAPDLWGDLCAP